MRRNPLSELDIPSGYVTLATCDWRVAGDQLPTGIQPAKKAQPSSPELEMVYEETCVF